ncbi:MAG: hypothetical protein D6718_05525 [Acidobacteria bacterium]|nr:MAG: hypothetical protein D6718_05525 [Acidobacteriota bacterium]
MTESMQRLRRSTRLLLERHIQGPHRGRVAAVLARAGVGKTAFLTGIGLDALLAGQRVLHVSLEANVEKVRDWYDELLAEQMRKDRSGFDMTAIHLQIERRRLIHSFLDRDFTAERLEATLEMLRDQMDFVPDVLVIDRLKDAQVDPALFTALRRLASESGAELWTSARVHRDGPAPRPGHLPPPADRVEPLLDIVFSLEPEGSRVRLHVLKDRGEILDRDLDILLDPTTLLLTEEAGRAAG